jgi:glycosyltransferase involved in cell wall biosynthesis
MIDGETGFTVNPKNYQQYADKILSLLNDSSLNQKMGQNARKRIEASFSQQKITQLNVAYYNEIINE